MHTHKNTNAKTHTHAHRHTHIKKTNTHTLTHTHRHTQTHTHTPTHTHTEEVVFKFVNIVFDLIAPATYRCRDWRCSNILSRSCGHNGMCPFVVVHDWLLCGQIETPLVWASIYLCLWASVACLFICMITVVCACGCVCVSYEYDESIQARKIIDSDPGQIYRSSNFLLNGNWTELGTPEDSMKLGPNTLVQTQLPTKNTQAHPHTYTHS